MMSLLSGFNALVFNLILAINCVIQFVCLVYVTKTISLFMCFVKRAEFLFEYSRFLAKFTVIRVY